MCDFGAIDELIVASLERWIQSALEDDWWFYFYVYKFVWVSGGRENENRSESAAYIYFLCRPDLVCW